MSEALSSAASSALAAAYYQLPALVAQPPLVTPPKPVTQEPINAPFYISPSYSFDPVAELLIVTIRDSYTGKVREQVPATEVVSRYNEAVLTGAPEPSLGLPPAPHESNPPKSNPTSAAPVEAAPQPQQPPAPTPVTPAPAAGKTQTIA